MPTTSRAPSCLPVFRFHRPCVLVPILVGLAGCGGTSAPPPVPDPAPPPAPGEPTADPAPGVVAVAYTCAAEAEERCNGVDDDCDGELDEGCGFEGGVLSVSLAWDEPVDLDVRVVGPGDRALDGHRASGACESEEPSARLEHVSSGDAEPAAGIWDVAVRGSDACGRDVGEATASVSVAVDGRVLGTWNATVGPGAEVPIASVELP